MRTGNHPSLVRDRDFFRGSVIFSVLCSKLFILKLDLTESSHVLREVWTSLQCNEELCFLAISSGSSDSDRSRSDLLESGVLVSINEGKLTNKNNNQRIQTEFENTPFAYVCINQLTYLTRFSEAMTLVETAFPRAWSSIVS